MRCRLGSNAKYHTNLFQKRCVTIIFFRRLSARCRCASVSVIIEQWTPKCLHSMNKSKLALFKAIFICVVWFVFVPFFFFFFWKNVIIALECIVNACTFSYLCSFVRAPLCALCLLSLSLSGLRNGMQVIINRDTAFVVFFYYCCRWCCVVRKMNKSVKCGAAMRYMAFEMGESGWNLFVCWKFIDTFIRLRVWKTCVVIEWFRCFVGWRSRVVCFHNFRLSFPGWMHKSINFFSFPLFDDAHILFSLSLILSISVFSLRTFSGGCIRWTTRAMAMLICMMVSECAKFMWFSSFFLSSLSFPLCVSVCFLSHECIQIDSPINRKQATKMNTHTCMQTNAAAETKDKSRTIRRKRTHARN